MSLLAWHLLTAGLLLVMGAGAFFVLIIVWVIISMYAP